MFFQVWIDWKCYIKRKLTNNKKEMMATGGGNCRLQHISPLEDKVIQLTGLVTNTSGISGAVDFGAAKDVQQEAASDMDISFRSEDHGEVPGTSKQRTQQSPKETTFSLLKEQVENQREFHEATNKFQQSVLEKFDDISTHLRRMNRSLEKSADIAAKQLEEERRHNKIKEELLHQKTDIKMQMFRLDHPSI